MTNGTGRAGWWKSIAWILVAIGVLIQFIPVERVNPPVEEDVAASPEVDAILRRACYDCHSHETRWPWYGHVAPASWLVAHDVDEGREYLNLSAWNRLDPESRGNRLEKICDEMVEGVMPPWYYLALHPEARLSVAEEARLHAWVRSRPEWQARPAGAPTDCRE